MTNQSIFRAFDRMWKHLLVALKNHSHDDLYYTETEIDERLDEIPVKSNNVYGYYIIAFDTENAKITLSTKPLGQEGGTAPKQEIINKWLELMSFNGKKSDNQYISFKAGSFFTLTSQVTGYDSSTGIITVDYLPAAEDGFNGDITNSTAEEYYIYAPYSKNAGEVLLFDSATDVGEGIATGKNSFGVNRSQAIGAYSFAANEDTIAGLGSASFGKSTVAYGDYSLTQGANTEVTTNGISGHAEGYYAISDGFAAHAEGIGSNAFGRGSHAEGDSTNSNGNYSHAEGGETISSGIFSHTEGVKTKATATGAHAEGYKSEALGNYSHAKGGETKAEGAYSSSEGRLTKALSEGAHAEGNQTIASASYAHAEGYQTKATEIYAHAEGDKTEATARAAHAEGSGSVASAGYSHAEGRKTMATEEFQHVQGKFNYLDENGSAGNYAHIVGGGTSNTDRKNIHTLDWYGNAWFANGVKIGGTNQDDENAKTLATEEFVRTGIDAIPIPDVSEQINAHNTDTSAHADIREEISNLQSELTDSFVFEITYENTDGTTDTKKIKVLGVEVDG